MKLRVLLLILGAGYLAGAVLLGPTQAPSRAQDPRPGNTTPVTGAVGRPASGITPISHPFDAVWEIMNRPRADKGCVNCHIAPDPRIGFWFGADKESVLLTLVTGVNPIGDVLDVIPVEGGRFGLLGNWLRNGFMPLGGAPWDDDDLALLDRWLILFE